MRCSGCSTSATSSQSDSWYLPASAGDPRREKTMQHRSLWTMAIWSVLRALVAPNMACSTDSGGCAKDGDCKGSRVCVSGECVDGSGGGGTTTSGGGGGTGGSSSGTCDGIGDCAACITCAADSTCSAEQSACVNSPDCTGLLDCLTPCDPADDICLGDCYNSYPDSAANTLFAFQACVECECPADCNSCP